MIIKTSNKPKEVININDIYAELCKDNRSVIVAQVLDEVFMFRPLSRIEYKQIIENDTLTTVEKEDVICKVCTLYPKNYDFENCSIAGIPTQLSNKIIENSYVNDVEAYNSIITKYREELSSDLDAQIVCIINAAFPNYDIEEIETWDIEKTAKYLTRAEFILMNFKDVDVNIPAHIDTQQKTELEFQEFKGQQTGAEENKQEKPKTNLKGGKKEKIDLEKLREAQEKFPEFDWFNDSVMQEGMDAFKVSSNTTPVALRTPDEF